MMRKFEKTPSTGQRRERIGNKIIAVSKFQIQFVVNYSGYQLSVETLFKVG